MAEIRLICPGCAAEYRVPESAIPPEGREVECSACGNVWHAGAKPDKPLPDNDLPRSHAAGDASPRLSRPLPDAVLDILKNEVEHERRARAAEEEPSSAPAPVAVPVPGPVPAPSRPASDPEWPATTITTAITRHIDPRPQTAAMPGRSRPAASLPARSQPAASPPATSLPATALPAAAPQPSPDMPPPAESRAAQQAPDMSAQPTAPLPAPAPRRAGPGYAGGFGLAVMLAAACVALYVLAPRLPSDNGPGDGLMQLRDRVDEARLWLQDRAGTLTR